MDPGGGGMVRGAAIGELEHLVEAAAAVVDHILEEREVEVEANLRIIYGKNKNY